MPVPIALTILQGTLRVGTTQAALDAFDCQVVEATLTANPKLNTVPATMCAPESQAAALTGFQLDLNVLQDWSDPAGVCWFAFDNDAAIVFWELSLDDAVSPAGDDTRMHGTAYCVPFGFGGAAGAPLQSTATWPIIGKPVKGPAPASLAADASTESSSYAEANA